MEDIISIIADASEHRPRYPSCKFIQLPQVQLYDAYERASWTSDRLKLERRRTRWRQKRSWSSATEEFALSRPLFENNSKLTWECTNVLGQGAFGTVGLWQQLDARGIAIDSIAIKEIEHDEYTEMAVCNDYSVPMEAYAMHEFRNTWSVPQLRQLIYLNAKSKSRWRMYQEFCPKGTVREMVGSYQEFNKKYPQHYQSVPEVYIWYVFFGLAKAILAMDNPAFNQIQPRRQPKGHRYVLHLDIKDANVLLADAFPHRLLAGYPVVKLCDWGITMFTSQSDPRNSTRFKRCGTKVWDPPEQCDENRLWRHWSKNPHGHYPGHDAPYTVQHSLWQISAVVFGMMCLTLDNVPLAQTLDKCRENEQDVRMRGMRIFDWTRLSSDTYSRELLDLINDCLNIDPRRRPPPADLVQHCKNGLRMAAKKCEEKGRFPPVFYGPDAVAKMEAYVQPGKRRSDPYHVQQRRREAPRDDGDKMRFGFRFN